jgi:hypothetical protein
MVIGGNNSGRVEIAIGEVVPADSPAADDRRVKVNVTCRGFSAHDCEAWISAAAWARFGRELHALEASRRGEALLISQSPAGLRLRLHAWDHAGHIAVEGHVGGSHVVAGKMHETGLTFAFEVDAGLLAVIVRGFEALTGAV